MNIEPRSFIFGIFVGAGAICIVHFVILILRPWRHAVACNVQVHMSQIIGMRLRGNSPTLLVDAFVILKKQSVDISIGYVEVVYIENKNAIDTPEKLAELVKIYMKKHNI